MFKIGLLGASWIAPQAIIDPASILPNATIAAVAARGADRAQRYADTYGIATSYGSYEALLADPEIDIIYVSLPPSHHALWSIRALRAGKHVICEKPTAMNLAEAEAMVAAAEGSGKRLIEAFHSRYHPVFESCLSWVTSGRIGTVQTLRAHFGVGIKDDGKKNQYRPELGGGCIMDMGCYPLHWVTQILQTPIEAATVRAVLAASGVDESMEADLTFKGGISAKISASMHPETQFGAFLEIVGTGGRIDFQNPLVPHRDGALTLQTDSETISAPISTVTTYCYQLSAILDAITAGTALPTEGAGILTQQSGIDRLYAEAGLAHLRETTVPLV